MPTSGQTRYLGFAGFVATLLAAGGCAATAGGLGEESGPERLPPGVVFLDSFERECAGTFHVGEETIADAGLREQYFVDPGQNATYRVRDNSIEWDCILGDDDRTSGQTTCPGDTSYVRFTRGLNGERVLLECFGYPL